MFLNILIPALILIALAIVGMALSMLIRKNGRFPAYQVGHNREMAKRGIRCVRHEEIRCHRQKTSQKECGDCQQLSP